MSAATVRQLPEPVARLAAALPVLTLRDLVPAGSPAGQLRAAASGSVAGGHPRPAAVLVLLSPGGAAHGEGGLDVVLVERAAGPGAHGGQVALPGGGVDGADASPAAAALREAREETGLDDPRVLVLGALPELAVPVSRYLVTPVVAWQPVPTELAPGDPAEIAAVHRVPLATLADPVHRARVALAARPGWAGPGFLVGELVVWGFTALLLDALLRLTGLERPWDAGRVVDLPVRFAGRAAADPLDAAGGRATRG